MKFIFIVDYSKHSGSGHLKRTSYLASFIKKKKNKIFFFINGKQLDAKKKIKFPINKFEKKKIFNYDKKNTFIVFDSYNISKNYVNSLYNAGYKIIFFDDKIISGYRTDILINQNISFTKKDYKKIKYKKLLVGEKYSIISDNLKSIKKKRKLKKKIKDIMIDFGQSSSKEIKYFLDYFEFNIRVNYFIVIKKNWNNFYKLHNKLKNIKNVKTIFSDNLYFKTLANIDLAIGAYGFSEIEKKFLKIPTLAFSLSKDQKIIGKKNHDIQNNYLGNLNFKNIKKLNLLIQNFISDHKFFKRILVSKMIKLDDKGKNKIYKEISKL